MACSCSGGDNCCAKQPDPALALRAEPQGRRWEAGRRWLSDADVEAIAKRIVELMGDDRK